MRSLVRPIKHPDFDDCKREFKWREDPFRAQFIAVQHWKCGYCETISEMGEVDHFRPHAEISELKDPFLRLPQVKDSNRLDGERAMKPKKLKGYCWLKYDWENFVFACKSCNGTYKGSRFPLLSGRRKRLNSKYIVENYALINPYDQEDLGLHFSFSGRGVISAKSMRAEHSIVNYGLYRVSLSRLRKSVAENFILVLDEFVKNKNGGAEYIKLVNQIYRLGRDKEPYAGMVRIMMLEFTRLSWDGFLLSCDRYIDRSNDND